MLAWFDWKHDRSSNTSSIVALLFGLEQVLKKRSQFAKEVFSWASERPPDVSAPLDCTANPTTGRLEAFVTPNYDGVLNRCARNCSPGMCSFSGVDDFPVRLLRRSEL